MIRQYATPLAFKTAVEQRLRTEVARSGMDLQRRRQLFIFDRYLRLSSVFREAVILKGGLAIELRLKRARTTKDVDLRLVGQPEDVLSALQQVGRLDLGDHLSFEAKPDPQHPMLDAQGMTYQGRRYRAQAYLAAKIYGAAFGIDIAFAEPLYGVPEVVTSSRFLDFAGIEPTPLRIYPLETHIAEKLHAYTLPRERLNSRVKGLPDIALLAAVRAIEAEALLAAIHRTFEHRDTHRVPEIVPAPPEGWGPICERTATNDELKWRTLEEVTHAVRGFLDPLLAGGAVNWTSRTATILEVARQNGICGRAGASVYLRFRPSDLAASS